MNDKSDDEDFEVSFPRSLRYPQTGPEIFSRWVLAVTLAFMLAFGVLLAGTLTAFVITETTLNIVAIWKQMPLKP